MNFSHMQTLSPRGIVPGTVSRKQQVLFLIKGHVMAVGGTEGRKTGESY